MRPQPFTRHRSRGWEKRFSMTWNAQFRPFERVPELVHRWAGDSERRSFAVFPFTIVYAQRDETIVIVAIAHQRRRPGYWRGRQ